MAQFKPCGELTDAEKAAIDVARVGFISACPFYANYFIAEMEEVFTKEIPTAGTDGRRLFINPEYLAGLKAPERVFVYAHEVEHVISRHPQRMATYNKADSLRGLPFDKEQFNHATDYVINAGLIESRIGMMNVDWLYDPTVTGDMLAEDVYVSHYKKKPPGGGKGQGQGQGLQGSTYGSAGNGPSNAKGDPQAKANGGGFDEVYPPEVDPVTGREDVPTDAEFKEAIARAAAAAKTIGTLPARMQRMVDQILEPQTDWKEHVRMLLAGKLGHSRETWDTLNRRYAALGALSTLPIPQFPGRKGFGADTVAVAIDTSGSIGEKELSAFFAEVGGVLADVKPKRVILIWCDAEINRVDEARTLDELADIRAKGGVGGGGTSFIPPFEYLKKEGIRPETLIYLTDLYGPFPNEPNYPVVWAATTDQPVPWGDCVRIKIEG